MGCSHRCVYARLRVARANRAVTFFAKMRISLPFQNKVVILQPNLKQKSAYDIKPKGIK
jgi:hypothetical protein